MRHYIGPKSPQIWCYTMVSFLNHIASILSERGLRCGAVYYPLLSLNPHPLQKWKQHGTKKEIKMERKWNDNGMNIEQKVMNIKQK